MPVLMPVPIVFEKPVSTKPSSFKLSVRLVFEVTYFLTLHCSYFV